MHQELINEELNQFLEVYSNLQSFNQYSIKQIDTILETAKSNLIKEEKQFLNFLKKLVKKKEGYNKFSVSDALKFAELSLSAMKARMKLWESKILDQVDHNEIQNDLFIRKTLYSFRHLAQIMDVFKFNLNKIRMSIRGEFNIKFQQIFQISIAFYDLSQYILKHKEKEIDSLINFTSTNILSPFDLTKYKSNLSAF